MIVQRQRQRKTVTGGRAKDRERGRLFFVEGLHTEKEEDNSRWKGHRQRKRKTVPGDCPKTEKEEDCSGGRAKDRNKRNIVPGGRAKDRERGRLSDGRAKDRNKRKTFRWEAIA